VTDPDTLPTPPRWLAEVPFAHRGLHGDGITENTLAAFEAAAAAGVGVELDVRSTADGVPVVFHDADLDRLAGRAGLLDELSHAELATVRLEDGDAIPTLEEALRVLATTPTMVELKTVAPRPGDLEPAVARLLAGHRGPVCMASFNPRAVGWFRRNAGEVVRVQTSGPLDTVPMPAPVRWSLRTLRWMRHGSPHAVSYDIAGIDHPAVQGYRDQGGCVVTWTVTTAAALARARRFADNVIFEAIAVDTVRAR
jgi:glycerophosphoryl diester phosphodiesterase